MVLSRKFSFISILLLLITLLICAILFILWLTRAYRNLHHLLPNSKKKYPYWFAAVAWYIPFFNLIAPYNIATDLFDKTERYLLGMGYMDLKPKYDIIKGWWWATRPLIPCGWQRHEWPTPPDTSFDRLLLFYIEGMLTWLRPFW